VTVENAAVSAVAAVAADDIATAAAVPAPAASASVTAHVASAPPSAYVDPECAVCQRHRCCKCH
jgi:hypothetical protein